MNQCPICGEVYEGAKTCPCSMNKTARAREIMAGFPNTPDGRYQAASVLMSELGITRNHARVLIHAALRTSAKHGGKREGAGRHKKPVPSYHP